MTSAINQQNGGCRVDTEQLLATGVLTGPHRRTRPVTLTMRTRFFRWVRSAWRKL